MVFLKENSKKITKKLLANRNTLASSIKFSAKHEVAYVSDGDWNWKWFID